MTASVPSRTAIEMSDTSARVGAGFWIMLSSMLVATITGLPRLRQPCTCAVPQRTDMPVACCLGNGVPRPRETQTQETQTLDKVT